MRRVIRLVNWMVTGITSDRKQLVLAILGRSLYEINAGGIAHADVQPV
ncbi:hypothetical protein BH23BAC3_BH23BAC3_30860 [soil metagenome]